MNKTTVIAEVGINHNGDIKIAKKLIDAAVFAGADVVKFQKRTIDKVYSKEYLDSYRESPWGKTQRDQKEGLEFNQAEYNEIDRYCKEKGILWCASVWDLGSTAFLEKYNLQYNKIPSALLTHTQLLKTVAKEGKHTFISTGMSTMDEIQDATTIFNKANCSHTLMHCNSAYPMPYEDANLNMISVLIERFKNVRNCQRIGYSGHEVGLITSIVAVALGAEVIERHITLDRSMYGSDQASSIEPIGFYRLVESIRIVEKAMGNGIKRVTDLEEKVMQKLRRTQDF